MNSELIHNIEVIITFLFTIKVVAVAIVNLTPTPEDNKWLGHFYRVLEIVAGIITPAAKELPGERLNPAKRVSAQSQPEVSDIRTDSDQRNDLRGV